MDVGEDAASGDGGRSDKLVQLLVVAHSEHDVSRSDGLLLVLSAGIARELKDLAGDVLEHGSHVDAATDADSLGVAALLKITVRATDWEDQIASTGVGLVLSTFTGSYSSWHL